MTGPPTCAVKPPSFCWGSVSIGMLNNISILILCRACLQHPKYWWTATVQFAFWVCEFPKARIGRVAIQNAPPGFGGRKPRKPWQFLRNFPARVVRFNTLANYLPFTDEFRKVCRQHAVYVEIHRRKASGGMTS